ncbi:hypothetical protein ACHAW5_008125 [Stephanodiscus triporus]|uniref:BZIP domain-containing protein n=1 Tax=Stephanodiscus triporus TaxID=2934178 RepID=A0ABD3NIC0_9STRA
MVDAFGCLLDSDAPASCDANCGGRAETNRAGDGVLALPTLIHRGPGNASDASGNRYVLFFTLRPLYRGTIRGGGGAERSSMRRYDPELQIHAGCVLYNHFRRVMRVYAEGGCGLEGTFRSVVGLEASSQICKMKLLKDENAALKEENRRLRKKTATLAMLRGENGMLREENESLRARVPSEDRTSTTDDPSTKDVAWKIGNLAGRGGCL